VAKESIKAIDPRLHDFKNFLWLVWKHLNLPEPTHIQFDIADYLQDPNNKRVIIQAFRGVGKSWVTSAFVCWSLLMNPQTKILVVSASKTRSDDFSNFTKRLIGEMSVLAHLKARTDQRDSNVAFDVGPAAASHAPSVKSIGITGQLAGSRANLLIADDVEVPNNSYTQAMREKLSESVKEFDAVLSPGGRIILGTPQTEESLYKTLEQRGYQTRIWTARFPRTEKAYETYGPRLAPIIADKYLSNPSEQAWKPTDPDRFDDADLTEREYSYGRSGFALQFMLDTSLSDADRYPLKTSDLMIMNLDVDKAPVKTVWAGSREYIIDLPNPGFTGDRWFKPMWFSDEWADYQGSVLTIDPAGRGKDELGYAVTKMLNGTIYVTASGGLFGGYSEENLKKLAIIAMQHKINLCLIESNFGDGMFSQLIKPVFQRIYPVTVEEIHHTGQKERRIIDTLEPVLNQHRIVIDEKVVKADNELEHKDYRLFYQLTRITKDRGSLLHEDRLEALSMGVHYWVEHMAKSQDSLIEDHREAMLKAELERFSEHVFGWSQSSDLWVDPMQ
jgi:hypothetical protein